MSRESTRHTIESFPRLDVAGAIGAAFRERWPDAKAGDRTRLAIDALPVLQFTLVIEWLPTQWGGTRPLFRCPRCMARRRVLLVVADRVWCRGCLRLNGRELIYLSQRVDPAMRAQLRTDKLVARLGGRDGTVDSKPPRMWWRTYNRIAALIDEQEALRQARMRWPRWLLTRLANETE